ncbi:MAG: hypothetical protein ACAH11_12545, partial [Sphingomonas sp.]
MTKQILTGMSSRALVNGNEAMLGNNRASIAISPGEGLGDTPAELRVDDAAMTRIVELDGPTGQQFGSSTVSLTTAGAASTENFNSLVGTGSGFVNTTLPTGWYVDETLGGARDNEAYGVDTGGSTTGDTYSYGTAASSDRALGQLRSGTVTSSIGAQFTNNTGSTLGSLQISFTGEQWRFGGTHTTVGDKLNFQISFDATSLTTGTWVDIDSLDFSSPVTTGSARALDGNHTDNRTAISATIASLAIANGATFWIRFIDVDATSSDDGLAIDDFSITPIAADGPTPGVLTIANVTTNEGNSGTTDMVFT